MSKIDLNQLDDIQYDVLKEIGNIGAGNATTALSKMLNQKMDMSVPKVELVPFNEISDIMGDEDQTVVGKLRNCCKIRTRYNITYFIKSRHFHVIKLSICLNT